MLAAKYPKDWEIHNMNEKLRSLREIAERSEKMMVGLMAGTSCDGLDVALCRVEGVGFDTTARVERFKTISYPGSYRRRLDKVAFRRKIDQQELAELHRDLGRWYGEQTGELLEEWEIPANEVDLIASHGQTVFHEPSTEASCAATLQIGDGDQIARSAGVITISDFRQKMIAAGGEGAPLTPFVDRLLFSSPIEARFLLNIGGIANFTWLGKREPPPEQNAFGYSDTGPGNTLIDAAVRYYFPKRDYDDSGEIAEEGDVQEALLDRLLDHPFFGCPMPKSTGPEAFSLQWVFKQMREINREDMDGKDVIATLTRFTVESIVRTLKTYGSDDLDNASLYVSGGGLHNRTLMRGLTDRIGTRSVHSFETLGVDPHAREALSFAVLANQSISGRGIPVESDRISEFVKPGKISML